MRTRAPLAAVLALCAASATEASEVLSLFSGGPATALNTMRDAGRMAREYVYHEIASMNDPQEGPYAAWALEPRDGTSFADVFVLKEIPRPLEGVRVRLRCRGAGFSLAVKVQDARGAEWTVPPRPVAEGADWSWVEWSARDFAIAGWSRDEDGVFDFPCEYLAVIAFELSGGHTYAVDIARVEVLLPDRPTLELRELRMPAWARAGDEVEAELVVRAETPLSTSGAALAFYREGSRAFAAQLVAPMGQDTIPPGEEIPMRAKVRVPAFAWGGTYSVRIEVGFAGVRRETGDITEEVATMSVTPRSSGQTSAKVAPHNGTPTLFINGTPTAGMAYMAYRPSVSVFSDFARQGVRLFSFSATPTESGYGLARTAWTAPNTYDFSQLDERTLMVLEACPDAYFFPRIYLHAPEWWSELHPDDLVVEELPDGTRQVFIHAGGKPAPSWASEAWREDTVRGIERLVRYVEESPYADRVIGYHIASGTTEEWMMWGANEGAWVDYSPANLAKFRGWLAERYGSDAALREAWGEADATLATADIPSRAERERCLFGYIRDPARERRVIDFYEYNSWLVADTISYFARATKRLTRGERAVGVFYGYLLQLIGEPRMQNAGHLALDQVLQCPDVDFLTSPTSYMFRHLGSGTSHFMSLTDSVKHHGKLWFDENDIRTSLTPGNTWDLGKAPDLAGDMLQQDRELANVLANGCAQWWFDVGANRYDAPELMEHIGRWCRAADRTMEHDRSPVDEIAVVVDGPSLAYMAVGAPITWHLIARQIPELARIGAPVGYYTAEDLRDLSPRRMYVFLNALAPSPTQRGHIERLKSEGRVLVFVGPAGVYRNGQLDPAGMSELCGMTMALEEGPAPLLCEWSGPDGPETYGTETRFGPVAWANDPDAERLGALPDGRAGLAVRRHPRWTAVHSAAPALPAKLLRMLASEAGVHLYAPLGDVVWATREVVAVSVSEGGTRPITLRDTSRVIDLATGVVLAESASSLDLDVPTWGTRLLGVSR